MSAIVKGISYFPVKGLAGTDLAEAELRTDGGIPLDRAFAFRYRGAGPIGVEHLLAWAPKTAFAVQHDWPGLARLRCELRDGELRLEDPRSGALVSAKVDSDSGRAELGRFLTELLTSLRPSVPSRHQTSGELELVGSASSRTRYPDRGKMHVSILNLASLRDLEGVVGAPVDIRRFRGNLIVDGIPAWSEFEWEKKTLEIGGARLEIKAPLLRCHNINVDPDSGEDGTPVLETLRERFSHIKFGMVGTVVESGTVAVGDVVVGT